MPDPKALPHLLALLDDKSIVVQTELQRAFSSLYQILPLELAKLEPLSDEQRNVIHTHTEPARREELLVNWSLWRDKSKPTDGLEFGLDCIARYQNGILHPESVSSLLDETAKDFSNDSSQANEPRSLIGYLFEVPGLRGDRIDYYSPRNSNLVHVLKTGCGNPISLTCILILLASRLGFEVQGCNYPGHFLARVKDRDETFFVDCFSGGTILDFQLTKVLRRRTSETLRRELLHQTASTETILTRVLRNLVHGYRLNSAHSEADLFLFLLRSTTAKLSSQLDTPSFKPGQLVRHRRYNYRGVVADYDLVCSADDDWYNSNQRQPDKEQPWYSVLVDGTQQVTYAAQTSLESDDTCRPIEHPLVKVFFSKFESNSYSRNERPWPEK